MKYADILRSEVEAIDAERAALKAEADALTPDETRSVDEIDARANEIIARSAELKEQRAAKVARIAELEALEAERAAAPVFIRQPEQPAPTDVRSLGRSEARDAALRVLDSAPEYVIDARRKAHVETLLRSTSQRTDGDKIARRLLVTESDAYRSAFMKSIGNPTAPAWNAEEARAVEEFRAMSIGTDTSGGFGIPVLIDPTIIISTGTLATPLLNVARIETITNDEWKGVSAAGTAWSFDAEAAEVSDDTSTFAQPNVKAHMARGFIPYSIEVGADYPGFATEMGRLLMVGYEDLLANKMVTGAGDGSNEPFGIFTALDANTNAEVVVTTNAQFGADDIDKVWAALPERWRARATWLMSVSYENKIRAFGSGTATSRFTVDQTREGISLLNGRPVILSDYAPAFATTTTARNLLVVGDFSHYLVAQRAGMTVEMIPHLFGTTNNRPTGQRGLFAYARVGADSVLDTAFRILTNT